MRVYFCFLIIMITISTQAQQPVTGKTFRDCTECPEMIVIPSGTFMIGSPKNETGHFVFEEPQKKIDIREFAVGKFDITRGQWAAFVSDTKRPITGGCAWSGIKDSTRKAWESNPDASWNHLGFEQDDQHPVVCITWFDARDYVNWLSKKTGQHYRLLSEAEWEYAARAGTTTAFPWGNTASHEYANYGLDSGFSGFASGRDRWFYTSPVGSFPPNAFGLYDMQGNVLQFVEDCFSDSYSEIPDDGTAYQSDLPLKMTGRFSFMNGTGACSYRICRGGDWGDPLKLIRSGFRNWAPGQGFTLETYRSGGVGFRVAKTITPEMR